LSLTCRERPRSRTTSAAALATTSQHTPHHTPRGAARGGWRLVGGCHRASDNECARAVYQLYKTSGVPASAAETLSRPNLTKPPAPNTEPLSPPHLQSRRISALRAHHHQATLAFHPPTPPHLGTAPQPPPPPPTSAKNRKKTPGVHSAHERGRSQAPWAFVRDPRTANA